ncbi:MAG: glutamate 5-kinase [Acidobacteria bacterium]|nr:MAG: glutamate 5-kinase [Acidobacteriota bacterium]
MRERVREARRVVVKLGSNLFFNDSGAIALGRIFSFIEDIAAACLTGRQMIVVSSGAVALGADALKMKFSTASLAQKQALAAVGQSRLMNLYEQGFAKYGLTAAQVLLTEEDFSSRKRYLNLRHTLTTLLEMGVVPVINENDTVSTTELEITDRSRTFGDNDKLSALVMSKLEATLLILLSDVDGLFTDNPRENPKAELIPEVHEITADIQAVAGRKSTRGRGGMATKLVAARVAMNSGGIAIIANGLKAGTIGRVLNGANEGTLFVGRTGSLSEKRRWIAFASAVSGRIHINAGALDAITKRNASLLYAGVTRIENQFERGDVVSIVGPNDQEVARGIVNYSSEDASKLIGKHSDEIARVATSKNYDAFITRNNIAFLTD